MSDYADTGFICSLYAPDANTDAASGYMEQQGKPVLFSWLNQVEFRNAMRLRVFRREITSVQKDQSILLLMTDLRTGVFAHADPVQSEVMIETESLSARYSESLGTRSLDILHVALAVVLGARNFLTFDLRQANLAKAVGLNVETTDELG